MICALEQKIKVWHLCFILLSPHQIQNLKHDHIPLLIAMQIQCKFVSRNV